MIGQMKMKLLYIADYLYKYSDPSRPIGAEELIAMLNTHGLDIERKTIYADVATLKKFGMKIKFVRHPAAGYYVMERQFTLPELRFLMDSLKASGSLSQADTNAMIKKLSQFCNEIQFENIKNEIAVEPKFKSKDNCVIENIGIINDAIKSENKIKFSYTRRMVSADGKSIRSYSKAYELSPYGLIIVDDHYYVIGYYDKHDQICQFRVDKIKTIEVLKDKVVPFTEVSDYTDKFDVQDYAGGLFHMFSGEKASVEILCDNDIIDPVYDHFGTAAEYEVFDENRFTLKFEGYVSKGLASYIIEYGKQMKVVQPLELRNLVTDRAKELLEQYSTEE